MCDATLPARWPLPDGRAATLRPISADDFGIESAFLDTLSTEASYNRLFSVRRPSADEIRRWVDIDAAREFAFVVTTPQPGGGPRMLAVGRAVHDDDGRGAEFALLVGDDCRRQGLGGRLLAALVDEARRRGLPVLHGTTLSTNAAMLGLARRCGFASRREIGDSLVTRVWRDLR